MTQSKLYDKREYLCDSCRMYQPLCICDKIEKIDLKTKLSVIIPNLEFFKSSNTGSLVDVALKNSEIFIKGRKDSPLNADNIVKKDYNNFILYPGGLPLTKDFVNSLDKPINLIVPDGTWRSAPKIIKQEPKLYTLKRVTLSQPKKSRYKVRKSPVLERISTFEAIIYALDVIEDNQELTEELMNLFLIKVDRLLWLRGKLLTKEVKGGIPQKAINWRATGIIDPK